MKHAKHPRQILKDFGVLSNTLWISALVSAIFLSLHVSTFAQQKNEKEYRITLKSRTFTPQPGIKSLLRDSLVVQLERGEKRHVYLQLKKHLTLEERTELEKQGIKLLSYIGSYTWYTTVTNRRALEFTSPDTVKRIPILGTTRWIGEIQSKDKISSKILKEGVGKYNRNPDGTVDVVILFFSDVSMNNIKNVVGRYGRIISNQGMLNDVVARLAERNIELLAKEDIVQWIEEVGPPDKDLNDGACPTAGVNPLWGAPYNLDGTNVQVGQWESGNPDDTHGDLTGRITFAENVGISDHATHVAGTIAGNGSLSAGEGGTPNQWRGVADHVDIYSYSTVGTGEPEDHNGAINTYGIDISTNSWSSGGNNYRSRSAKYDRIVRGIYERAIPIVFAASNANNTPNSVKQPGGTAKNTIVVGNINSDDNSISIKSSWGPTDEDQLKPDVVAPGDQTGGDGAITSCVANGFIDIRDNTQIPDGVGAPDGIDDYTYPYGIKTGTSMAAPVVAGVIGLMLQQYRETYFRDETQDEAPLPSTFKAILCHTAEDLDDNPTGGADLVGPDYVYGYGLINAQEAVNTIRDKRFREGVILSEDDEDMYTFNVSAGEDELKVTLIWDDEAGTPGVADILQNDLDLMLLNPAGDEYYPPWELDPDNPTTPAGRNFYASEALADNHRDEFNVVEQVAIENPDPGTWKIKVKASDLPYPYQRYSLIAGDQQDHQLEGKVDVMQVLDRSGSMDGRASATSTDKKIDILKIAADHFVEMMKPDIGNQLGLVQFNQNVVPFDPVANLTELTSVRADELRVTTIPSIDAGGRTSIGDGLFDALNQFPDLPPGSEHDQVILLVTDGKENEPRWINDVEVKDALIADNIAVYPLGLGYGSGIDEDKLTELAEATGGTYRITSDGLIFRKFFIEILAGAVRWEVIIDPIGQLGKNESVTIPVSITSDQDGATFTAYWEGIDSAIELKLISAAHDTIDLAYAKREDWIRYGVHPRYVFFQLNFPMSGLQPSEWAGEWQMLLVGTNNILGDQRVRYSASAFAEKGPELDVSFDKFSHLTGDSVLVTARLTKGSTPLPGAKIDVFCNVPLVGPGNLLHEGKVSMEELKKEYEIKGEVLSLIDNKLRILTERAGKDIFLREETSFPLYDDGIHGDGNENDGTYANSFPDTKVQGSYTFRFVASDIPTTNGQKTTREWTQSFYNEVNIDPEYSVINVKIIGRAIGPDLDGWYYAVKVAPRDKFNNYRGPGRPVTVNIVHKDGSRGVKLNDNIDGTYTEDIYISQRELDQGAKLVVETDGKTFTTIEKLPTYPKWALSVHSGTAIPIGSLANNFDQGFNVLIDIGYRFTPQLSLVGYLGYNDFKSKTTGIADNYWNNLSLNLKYRRPLPLLSTSALYYYIQGGFGYYIPKTGDSGLGANFGAGFNYDFSSSLTFEVGNDYHTVFDNDVKFWHAHAGIIFRF